MDGSYAPHGLLPMQAAGAFNHPISLQPFGQWSLRVVCGVAALANSQAIGCTPRLAYQPAKTAARPLRDRKQALKALGSGTRDRPPWAEGMTTGNSGAIFLNSAALTSLFLLRAMQRQTPIRCLTVPWFC